MGCPISEKEEEEEDQTRIDIAIIIRTRKKENDGFERLDRTISGTGRGGGFFATPSTCFESFRGSVTVEQEGMGRTELSEFFPNMFLGRDPFGFDEFGRLQEERRSLFSDGVDEKNGWQEKAGSSSSTRKSEYVFSANGETVKKTVETQNRHWRGWGGKNENSRNDYAPRRSRRENGTRRVGAARAR